MERIEWSLPSDFLSYDHYLRVLCCIDMKSSPGYPYMINATTNKQLFGHIEGDEYSQDCVDHIWQIVRNRISELSSADPIRLFIKKEPVKLSKLRDGRSRLISSVSVIDQIIDHMLFDDFNQSVVSNFPYTPIKVGWSPYGGNWKLFPKTKRLAVDKSSWDWTVHTWYLEFILKLRSDTCKTRGPLFDKWYTVALYRYKQLFGHPLFVTSNGLFLRQKEEGVQKSGCVNTLIDNSLMQLILHARVCYEHGISPVDNTLYVCGDDTSQTPVCPEYADWLAEYSIVKQAIFSPEFCGMHILPFKGIVQPLYTPKHAFNLLHISDEHAQEIAYSYCILYNRSPYREWMRSFFKALGLETLPYHEVRLITDGIE